MAQLRSNFLARPTTVGIAVLALAGLGTLDCGGTGERVKPDTTATADAGLTVDPCNLSATLVTQPFGCTPGQGVFCADFEGFGTANGAMPTGWFRYIDKIAFNPSFIDPNTGKVVVGDPNANDTYERMTDADRHCGNSNIAYHMLAENQDVWGPQFGLKFTGASDGPLPRVNVSKWDGIGFWIKKGNDHAELNPTGTSLFVSLSDPNTTSNTTGKDTDPPCNDSSNFDNKKCDAYGAGVSFDAAWRYIMIPFDDMKQRGYGVYEAELNRSAITQVKFGMDIGDAANGNWNVWIDDIVQYRHK